MKGIIEYLIRMALLSAILAIGVGLIVLGNFSDATAQEASAVRAVRTYDYEVDVPALRPRDPLTWDQTMHMIGGWGCSLRGTFPHSILGANQCF